MNMRKTFSKSVSKELRHLDKIIKSCYETKSYGSAFHHVNCALKLVPGNFDYRVLKAECLALLGRVSEATVLTEDLIKLNNRSTDAIYVQGLCCYLTEKLEKSIFHCEHALELDPDHKKATELFKKSQTLKGLRDKAKALYLCRRYREAQAIYTDALKMENFHKLLFNRAVVSSKVGLFDEAIQDCTRLLETNKRYVKALLLRARCYIKVDKFKECVKDYRAALRLKDTSEIRKLLQEAKLALQATKKHSNYYEILGVPYSATANEIKKAYRMKALEHHPDKHVNKSPEYRKKKELQFKKVGEAYATLSDVEKKGDYDAFIGI